MEFENGVVQSAMDLRSPRDLVLRYCTWMLAPLLTTRTPRKIALLGLGGGALARFALAHGVRQIDAAEIDAAVASAARNWFDCEDKRLDVTVADARELLADNPDTYDCICTDLFDAHGVPHWSTHAAFHDLCLRALRPGGWMVANLAPLDDEERDDLLTTLRRVYPGGVGYLGVPDTGNTIAFGFSSPPHRINKATLNRRARALSRRTGVPFGLLANALLATAGRRGQLRL